MEVELLGDAVKASLDAGPGVKGMEAVAVSVRLSVVSLAVKIEDPAFVEVTVKVTIPLLLEVPEAGVSVSIEFRLDVKLIVLPAMGWRFASVRVTVMTAESDPLAVTEEEEAITVEAEALAGPAIKEREATAGAIKRLSVVSVAVKVADPTVVDVTVKVATPFELETLEEGERVSAAFRLEARVTVFPETGLFPESRRVTETIEEEVPSAVTDVEEALKVEVEASTGPSAISSAVTLEYAVTTLLKETESGNKRNAGILPNSTGAFALDRDPGNFAGYNRSDAKTRTKTGRAKYNRASKIFQEPDSDKTQRLEL